MNKTPKISVKRPAVQYKLVSIGLIVLALLFVGQFVFDVVVVHHANDEDAARVTSLIIAAVENASKPAAIDARSGDAYFPEAKLIVPMSTSDGVILRYSYYPAVGSTPAELLVSNQVAVRAAESRLLSRQQTTSLWWHSSNLRHIFDEVPNLQSCARGVHVRFTNTNAEGLKLQSSAVLNDGRTIYLYTESNTACVPTGLSSVVTLLEQAKSY